MNANVNENVLVNGVNNNVEESAKVEKKKAQKTTAATVLPCMSQLPLALNVQN